MMTESQMALRTSGAAWEREEISHVEEAQVEAFVGDKRKQAGGQDC